MSDDLRVDASVTIPASELHWRFSRSSGPGGQSVNTTDSRVELSWNVAESAALDGVRRRRALDRLRPRLVDGVITVTASTQRSQWHNRQEAERRLVGMVQAAIAPPPPKRVRTRPSKAAVQRRIESKRRRGTVKRLRGSINDD